MIGLKAYTVYRMVQIIQAPKDLVHFTGQCPFRNYLVSPSTSQSATVRNATSNPTIYPNVLSLQLQFKLRNLTGTRFAISLAPLRMLLG